MVNPDVGVVRPGVGVVRTDVEASGEDDVQRWEPVSLSNGEDLKYPPFSALVEDLKWPPSMAVDRKLPPSVSGWVLAGWDECLLEEEEEEDDEEEEGLESSFRPSSSLSELNSSSCLCCSSNKDIFPLLVVAPAVTCPCPFCPNPTTRPVPWVLCPWPPLDQSMELRDFLEF